MIVFDLKCPNGHKFEGWFDDSRAFEKQKKKKMIECPVCGEHNVDKALSAIAIKKTSSVPSMDSQKPLSPNEVAAFVKNISDYIDTNYEDVGTDFAREALKIHYGVSEKRKIKGSSTAAEEKTLKDEGIGFLKLPKITPPDSDDSD